MNEGMIDFKGHLCFRNAWFSHVTSVLKMAAFGHVSAHPHANKSPSMWELSQMQSGSLEGVVMEPILVI